MIALRCRLPLDLMLPMPPLLTLSTVVDSNSSPYSSVWSTGALPIRGKMSPVYLLTKPRLATIAPDFSRLLAFGERSPDPWVG
jgi:hypothetical protein